MKKRKKEFYKRAFAIFTLISILNNVFFPTAALALTSGPSQPEVQSFEPIGTSEMVDLFSGDFNYNIPLLDVDGYPVNIAYHSGITMDQEASWVGLGWNINSGVVNRTMRGLPDDFNGDVVEKETNVKDNITVGVSAGVGLALAGFSQLGLNVGMGINYNNYVGIGVENSVSLSFNVSKGGKGPLSAGLGFKSSNTDGLTVSPSLSFSAKLDQSSKSDDNPTAKIGIGTSFNSRVGLKTLTINTSLGNSWKDKSGKNNQSGEISRSASFSFGAMTFVPQVTMSMQNYSLMFSGKVGGTISTADITVNGSGYFSDMALQSQYSSFPAFGYMYEQNGQQLDNAMLDFNREKDGEFSVNTPGLPVTNHTYDIYSVSGQGTGGSYRLHRGDVGYVFDSRANNTSNSLSLGAEVSLGDLAQVGIDVTLTNVNTTSGKWQTDNPLAGSLPFTSKDKVNNPTYEPAYFKQAGEKASNKKLTVASGPNNNYETFDKTKAVRSKLNPTNDQFVFSTSSGEVVEKYGNNPQTFSSNFFNERDRRTQEISYLKKSESNFMVTPFVNPNAKNDHVAEVSVIQPNGQRHVYGKPLYNITQEEVSFNVALNNHCGSGSDAGYVSYASGGPNADNSLGNQRGIDHFFSKTTIPAYAHSYLLTSVLSTDYVDVDGNGPSNSDFGHYTAFEYQYNTEPNSTSCSTTQSTSKYHWRTPYKQNMANYNENFKTRDQDDQGNYVYGVKEQAYLKYIKTKNYVAVFELNDPTVTLRPDAWGAANRDGGLPTGALDTSSNQSRYLKSITLYSRVDFEKKCANSAYPAFIIKKVNFEYEHEQSTPNPLCTGIENGLTPSSGKLTLNKIYFTYGTSNKGKFSSYEFTYGDVYHDGSSIQNPTYNIKAYNRWGDYKPMNPSNCSYNSPLSNTEFPYVEQDLTPVTGNHGNRVNEDNYASAWALTSIKLPSGGVINVDYESDDYAYVQDKDAMQMCKVIGYGPDINPANFHSSIDSYGNISTGDLGNENDNNGFFVSLQTNNKYNPASNITTLNSYVSPATQYRATQYFKDMFSGVKIYFRTYIQVNGANNNGYEYVSGYADVDPGTVQYDPIHQAIFFKLKQVPLSNNPALAGLSTNMVNPLQLAAVNFGRMKTSREAFNTGGEPGPNATPESIIQAFLNAGFLNTIFQTFTGPEHYLFDIRHLGHNFMPAKSWFRLYNPYHDKLGGGSRVKQIVISDNWNSMTSSLVNGQTTVTKTSYYGQSFDYTTTENINGVQLKVSSGVASYEPMAAGDENPFRQPHFSGSFPTAWLAPDNRYYVEEPFGESLFPSANIGYGKVTVRSMNLDNNAQDDQNVKRHATGYVVNEFYTAKDYPISTTRTDMDVKEAKSGLGGQLLQLDVEHTMTASQGYVVEMNDMHGKQKATWVYAEGQTAPMSGKQFFYKDNYIPSSTSPRYNGNKLMNDDVPIIGQDGKFYQTATYVGEDYDFVSDFREEETVTETAGAQINLYVFYVALPLSIPPIWPTYSKETVRVRTSVITKVINKYGIMDEVVAYENGASISTKNLVWDGETGEVLMTQTANEFDDPVFSFNYPVHWAYVGMGPAYINNLIEITSADINKFLVPGDVVVVNGTTKGWVVKSGSNNLVVDQTNTAIAITSTSTIKVIRSGRRNMQTESMAHFTSLSNPLPSTMVNGTSTVSLTDGTSISTYLLGSSISNILSASAIEFSDVAKMNCNCFFSSLTTPPTSINPYYYGLSGNWHPKTTYSFLTNRNQTQPATGVDVNYTASVRKDGTFTSFAPFYQGSLSVNPFNSSATTYPVATPGAAGGTTPYWTFTNSLSIFSVDGEEFENRDALNRYSAATFGYNNTLSISVSSNARYQEIGYDGLEDHDYYTCLDPNNIQNYQHFSFLTGRDNSRAHTGQYSVKVVPTTTVSFKPPTNYCVDQTPH